MKSDSLITRALNFLGAAVLLCLGGIIALAWAERSIPDVLVATTGTSIGAFSALLVGTVRSGTSGDLHLHGIDRAEGAHRAEGGHSAVELAAGVLAVVILVVVLLRLV